MKEKREPMRRWPARRLFSRLTAQSGRRRSRAGFTLIEILLVVVIIGILVGVAVPRFSGRTEEARKVSARNEMANIKTSLDMYELDNGKYPSSLGELVPKYMDKMPKDPWGNEYTYDSGNGTVSSGGVTE